jgi:outer membrane receptor protein involved in Fe transport
VPNRFTQRIRDYQSSSRVRYNAFYAQDQWTRKRLTLSGGVRYDNSWSYYPEQQIGGTYYLPQVTVFPFSEGVEGYHDITPRMGAVYDVFGTGKTALKFNAGRYLEAAVNDNGNYSELLPVAAFRRA